MYIIPSDDVKQLLMHIVSVNVVTKSTLSSIVFKKLVCSKTWSILSLCQYYSAPIISQNSTMCTIQPNILCFKYLDLKRTWPRIIVKPFRFCYAVLRRCTVTAKANILVHYNKYKKATYKQDNRAMKTLSVLSVVCLCESAGRGKLHGTL